jgi:non-heme chloroperoxidase
MSTITTSDGTSIFYKDWGAGQPIVFSHGWPLSADAWDEQLVFFASRGYRAIAHDRRGHGRSSQPSNGNDIDTYSDDLAALLDKLEIRDAILVGHSTGGGEVTRYLGRHGSRRVAKAAIVSAIPPVMIKSETNPGGLPRSVFDAIRTGVATDRSQYYRDLSAPFYGANRSGSKVPQGLRDQFWLQSMQAGLRGAYECIKVFSETDFNEDLRRIEVPVLVLHGDDDQIVPIDDAARLSAMTLKHSVLKVYPGAPHGLTSTHAEQFNADLLAFIKG